MDNSSETYDNEPDDHSVEQYAERVSDVANQLQSVSEHLNDLAMDVLRSAVEAGAGKRPELEKKLSAARRAVDKAVRTLERDS